MTVRRMRKQRFKIKERVFQRFHIMEILSLIAIAVITFFPILMWGYIFSYLDNSPLGARRFGLGIVAGALSVVPVLFMSDMMAFADLIHWNIFPLLVS